MIMAAQEHLASLISNCGTRNMISYLFFIAI